MRSEQEILAAPKLLWPALGGDAAEIRRLAELGRDLKQWRAIKAMALHGWIECSDGRLHHSVDVEGVNEVWKAKNLQRDRTAKVREMRLSQHRDNDANPSVTESVADQSQDLLQTLLQDPTERIVLREVQGERAQLVPAPLKLPPAIKARTQKAPSRPVPGGLAAQQQT